MMNIKPWMMIAGVVAPMVTQALDVSVSGKVNRVIRFADNGVDSDVQYLDDSAFKSRFRLTAEGYESLYSSFDARALEDAVEKMKQAERELEERLKSGPPVKFWGPSVRHSLLYFSGDFGKITLGSAPSTDSDIMWTRHNGAWAGTEYSPDTSSGLGVMNANGMSAEYSVFSFFPSVNTPRMNILRYDTPSIGPISVGASVQKDDATGHSWSFGASLAHDVGAANVIAGLVYEEDKLGIAGGLAFANGTSVNAAWGADDADGQDYEDVYINVFHSWGSMNVAVDYRSTENGSDMEGRAIGLGAQYGLGGGVDVYAGFNNYSFDIPGRDVKSFNAFHAGSAVVFK